MRVTVTIQVEVQTAATAEEMAYAIRTAARKAATEVSPLADFRSDSSTD